LKSGDNKWKEIKGKESRRRGFLEENLGYLDTDKSEGSKELDMSRVRIRIKDQGSGSKSRIKNQGSRIKD